MSNMLNFKNVMLAAVGALGSILAACVGGWSEGVKTFFIFMALDWMTGNMVPVIFKTSRKTDDGRYSSAVGLKGIAKKCVMIIFVGAAYRVDLLLNTGEMFRDGVMTAFIVNELMSIIENARDMGVPIPDIILNMVSAIKDNKNNVTKADMMIITALIASGVLVFATPAKAAPLAPNMPTFDDVYEDLYNPINPTIEEVEKPEHVEQDVKEAERTAPEVERKAPEAEHVTDEAEQDDEETEQDCTHGVLLDVWDDGSAGGGICENCGTEISWEYLVDDGEEEQEDDDDLPYSIWDGEEETEDDELS